MGDLVNLRLARKAKRRADKDREAAANRIAFGQSKAGERLAACNQARDDKHLDGHRLTSPSEDDRSSE